MSSRRVFLVSFPKSGNTWTRFLFANVLNDSDQVVDFHSVIELVPEYEMMRDRPPAPCPPDRPSVFKSHASFNAEFERVVYIVRDPRACYLSYFKFFRKRLPDEATVETLVRNQDALAYGSWSSHVLSWYGQPGVRFFRYEDLLDDPNRTFSSMLEFAGFPVQEATLDAAIRYSSFEQMKKLEHERGRPFLSGTDRRLASPFMRGGLARAWETELASTEAQAIIDTNARAMALLGYI